MKKNNFLNNIFYFLIIFLLLLNSYYFYCSIKISDEIHNYENKLLEVQNKNLNLERKLASMSSLEYAYKAAEKLGFNKQAKTIYFENLVYAYNKNQ